MGVPVKKSSKGKKAKRPARPQLTAEEHYEEAQMALIADQPEQAQASFKRALELEPDNATYLDMYGGFLAELGQAEEAAAVLQRAVALQPDQGFEKYMYLGQLLEGEQGTAAVRKGIELLRAKLQVLESGQLPAEDAELFGGDDEEGEEDPAELLAAAKEGCKEQLCSALSALGELLVAACEAGDEEEAAAAAGARLAAVEAEVEAALGEARQLCPESPEPLQALCNLRRQQDRAEEALQLLKQSMELWFVPPKSDDEEGEAQEAKEGGEEEDLDEEEMDVDEGEDDLPSYEFRFETAKLLLELDSDTERAVQVLEGLVEENDQVPNVWLLLAVALRGGGELEAALLAAEEGTELIKGAGLPDDDELVIAFSHLKTELEQQIEAGGGEEGGEEAAAK